MAFLQYLIAAVLVAGSQANSLVDRQTVGCQTFCPFMFMPVCGSNGQTFSNECHLNVQACLQAEQFSNEADYEPLTLAHQGMCSKKRQAGGCQTFCPFNFMPVCGSNGQTFSNECHLNVQACLQAEQFSNEADYQPLTLAHQGMCSKKRQVGGCQTFCPFNFMPVCGSNGQTFSNECHLNVQACLQAEQFSNDAEYEPLTLAHQGMCSKKRQAGGNNGINSCPTFCTFQFDPVCGSNGQTYSNSCQLSSAACMASFSNPDAEPITLAHPGTCF